MLVIQNHTQQSRFNKSVYAPMKSSFDSLRRSTNYIEPKESAISREQQLSTRKSINVENHDKQISVQDQQTMFCVNKPAQLYKHSSEVINDNYSKPSQSGVLPAQSRGRSLIKRDAINKTTVTGSYCLQPSVEPSTFQKNKSGITQSDFNSQRRTTRQKAVSQVSQLKRNTLAQLGEITLSGTDSKNARIQAATEFTKSKLEAGTVLPPASRQQ